MRQLRFALRLGTMALVAACSDQRLTRDSSPTAPGAALHDASVAATQSGSITIVLDMQPNRPTDVSFDAHGKKLRNFVLDDDMNSDLPNSRTFTDLKAGSYTVTQDAPSDLTLLGITCVSNSNGGNGVDNNTIEMADRSVTIQLESEESVTCTFVGSLPIWENGDLTTYDQVHWGDATNAAGQLLSFHFFSVYTSGLVEIGAQGTSGFSVIFTAPSYIISYLPAPGPFAALSADLVDPSTTSSGAFGGEVLALRLNIDFSDAGLLADRFDAAFGDLTLCNFGTLPTLNGQTVRGFSGLVNTLLGGGANGYTISDLGAIAVNLNGSFEAGTAGQYAQDHLVYGPCP